MKLKDNKHFLFSYGTLQLEKVQVENYGRILKGKKDSLPNYKLEQVRITNKTVLEKSNKEFHPIAIKTNNSKDLIEGTIFEITSAELKATDQYEVDDYIRVQGTFSSGKEAWVYVSKKQN